MLRRQILPDGLWVVPFSHPVFFRGRLFIILTMTLPFLAASFAPEYTFAQPDLHLLRSDDTGVTFDYVPAPVHRDTVFADGIPFDMLSIDYCANTTESGTPQLPQRRALIGLPPDAMPTVTLMEAPYREETGYRLAPAPYLTGDGLRYKANPAAYARTGMIPETPVTMGTAGRLRGYTVLPVTLTPVACNPATGRVRFYERMRVDIRFNAPSSRPAQPADGAPNAVFDASMLNAREARLWRQTDSASRSAGRPNVFGPGEWYKVSLTQPGMYRIDRQMLLSAGIDVNGLDPRTLRMFHGGGRPLPQDVDAPRPTLNELSIRVAGEEDGRFDENDYILFYGAATAGFAFLQTPRIYAFYSNPYTDTNVYWLSARGSAPGKRIRTRSGIGTPAVSQTDTPVRRHEEREITNPLDSGTEWFWQLFDGPFREEATFQVDLGKVARGGLVTALFRFQSKTRFAHHVQVFLNNNLVGERFWSGESTPIALAGIGDWLKDGVNDIRIVLPRSGASANQPDHVYFDWFELAYWTPLDASGGDLIFEQDAQSAGPVIRYQATGAASTAQTFDITDPYDVTQITAGADGAYTDSARVTPAQYRLVKPDQWKRPAAIARDTDSDLRNPANGADFILITHDDFIDAAEQLRAHRSAHSNLRVFVARTSDIYDEFSYGLFDPTAIRDFLRYAAFNWTGAAPQYALLLGDGNYDYKNHARANRPVRVPPFEDGDRCTDDYFVYFDGNGDPIVENDIFPDMAIGRLPAQTVQEADILVRKIVNYEAAPEFGFWRNTVVLAADDEQTPGSGFDEPFHIGDTERLAQRHVPPAYRVEKVYLTEYPLDAAGEKPRGRDDLIARITDGAVLVNWVGHGAANLWAHERIFNTSRDLPAIDNGAKLPVFVTATCTAGRFDLLTEEAMAEDFLRADGKGAVGFIGATRLSFPSPNAALNRGFYDGILSFDMTLGEALVYAKIGTVNRENSEKYTLFGDPAMRPGIPRKAIRFTDIPDTLRVLQAAAISGAVLNDTVVDQTFTGAAFIRASDSDRNITFVTGRGGQIPYELPGVDLFRGPVPVTQGLFSGAFITPKDITYGGSKGRITVYVTDGRTDGAGIIAPLTLQGADPAFRDSVGPYIEVLAEGRPITDGDYTSTSPRLTIRLTDESGINITGEVGHQIILQTDRDASARQDVTRFFVYDTGSFQQGSLQTELSGLTPGEHTVSVKAWDNFNNQSTRSVALSVVEDANLRITDVMNYPNPSAGPTTITFALTQDAEVTVQVFTVAGVLIRSFTHLMGFRGFNQVEWDGADRDGGQLANGVYLYKITARSNAPDAKTASVFGRLLVVR